MGPCVGSNQPPSELSRALTACAQVGMQKKWHLRPSPKGTCRLIEKIKIYFITSEEQKALWDDGALSSNEKGGAIHSFNRIYVLC